MSKISAHVIDLIEQGKYTQLPEDGIPIPHPQDNDNEGRRWTDKRQKEAIEALDKDMEQVSSPF